MPSLQAHPILDAAPSVPPWIPGLASLGATGLFVLGAVLGLFESPAMGLSQAAPSLLRSVSITLSEPSGKAQVGPGRVSGGLQRSAQVEGVPVPGPARAQAAKTAALPAGEVDPADLHSLPTRDHALERLGSGLPLPAGGPFPVPGPGGEASGREGADPHPAPAGRTPDHRIVAIRQVRVYHQLQPGEHADPGRPIRVQVEVGADGVPLEATLLSGPRFLEREVLAAARQWRFDPLARHGLSAPQVVVLNFHPVFTS